MKTYGFFFLNHSAHIYHAISVAFELSQKEECRVKVFTSTERNLSIIQSIQRFYPSHKCEIILVKPSTFYRVSRFLKRREFPGFKAIFSKNIDEFLACDVLVSPADDILILKRDIRFSKKLFIYTSHGTGDLGYPFENVITQFDYIFVSGMVLYKHFLENKNRLMATSKTKAIVIGYVKEELCKRIYKDSEVNFFENDNRTIVYIPHFDESYNSWVEWGEHIVNYFSKQTEFNLIVAPHILFSKKLKRDVLRACGAYSNIKADVDSDSLSLIDMTYLTAADIYIGDKSSQIYEFLLEPRPCIFLNSKGVVWKNSDNINYDSWTLGTVLESIENLSVVLAKAEHEHISFKDKQLQATAERISKFETGAAVTAADFLASL